MVKLLKDWGGEVISDHKDTTFTSPLPHSGDWEISLSKINLEHDVHIEKQSFKEIRKATWRGTP
jgi:hypothetical protein